MVQRICPICDTVMKSAHYCKNCKSWVKHPHMQEVSYRLNEEHPRQETDCTYHGNTSQGEISRIPSEEPSVPNVPRRQAPERQIRKKANSTPASSRKKLVIGTMVIYAIVNLFSIIDQQSVETIAPFSATPESEFDSGDSTIEGYNYIELNDDEVIAAGKACTVESHFIEKGEDIKPLLLQELDRCGYLISDSMKDSYNERYEDGETWYMTRLHLSVEKDGEANSGYQFLSVDYDTATGALHEIIISVDDPEQLGELVASTLDLLGRKGDLEADPERFQLVKDALAEAATNKVGYQFEQDSVLVDGISYDQNYFVTISRNRELD